MLGELLQPLKLSEAPFTRQYAGSGLGLAFVVSLAGHFCGRLFLESKPGVGTAATVYFPLGLNVVSKGHAELWLMALQIGACERIKPTAHTDLKSRHPGHGQAVHPAKIEPLHALAFQLLDRMPKE